MQLNPTWKYILSVTAVILSLSITGCKGQDKTNSSAPIGIVEMSNEGRQMPAFNLPTLLSEDTVLSSHSLQGKVVLVDFFASWCRSCLEEIPLLKKLQNTYGKQGLIIVALAVDVEDRMELKNLIQKQNINYQVLLADDEVKEDFGGISILPTMFLVDQKGKILKKYLGHIERDSLIRDIRQTLEH